MSRPHRDDEGIALVLVLIFTVLLYVLVAELVVTARSERLAGENDALMARMHNHMQYTLQQIEEQLTDDLAAGGGDESGMGDLGSTGDLSALGNGLPGAEGAGAGEEGEEDAASTADSSQDAWYAPSAYADDDLTTYVWVEDENRKFNLLTLVSPNREFADQSRERFVRLVDYVRDGTVHDLSPSDGENFAKRIVDWLRGVGRTEIVPRPPLKSDGQDQYQEITVPLHLEELLMIQDITPEIFWDRMYDNKLVPGLASVLTIHTANAYDPGDPDDPNNTPASNNANGGEGEGEDGQEEPAANPSNEPAGMPTEPAGIGIRVNINTASRAVLRSLLPEFEMPDSVIEAILRYRNEEVEEEDLGTENLTGGEYFGDFDLGSEVKRQIFETVDDLDQLPEFANLGNPDAKEKFLRLVTTQSDVFSIHMASMFKRNEERKQFVLRRTRTVVFRSDDGSGGTLHPLVLMEETHGLRIQGIDFPDEYFDMDYELQLDEMDEFAAEERRWNPFYIDFYRKKQR